MSTATPAAVAAPAEPKGGATATALYDYEAAGEFEVIFCRQLMKLTLSELEMRKITFLTDIMKIYFVHKINCVLES